MTITTTSHQALGSARPHTIKAEWIKITASRGNRFAFVLLVALTVGFSVFIANASHTEPAGSFGDDDIMVNALGGVLLGLIVATVVGAITIGNEYGSGMIATTFTATPRRHRVLLAKAGVVWAATTIVGIAAAFASFFVTRPLQRANGFIEPGYPNPDLTGGPALRAIIGTGLLIGLFGLSAVGVGAAVKRTAVAIPVVIGSIIVPAMAAVDEQTTRLLSRWTPIAAFAIQHTVDRPDYYIAPWAGLAVMASYAGLAVAAGLVVTHRRDV